MDATFLYLPNDIKSTEDYSISPTEEFDNVYSIIGTKFHGLNKGLNIIKQGNNRSIKLFVK